MHRRSIAAGLVLGGAIGLLALALQFLASRALGLPFAAFDVFEWITRLLPGPLITAAIDLMVAIITGLGIGPISVAAKIAEKVSAVAAFLAASIVLGGVVALASRRAPARLLALGAGGACFAVAVASEIVMHEATLPAVLWNAVVFVGWGLVLAWSLERTSTPAAERPRERTERRRLLGALVSGFTVGAGALFGLSALFSRLFGRAAPPDVAAGATVTSAALPAVPVSPGAPPRLPIVPGTRQELTPNERFYRIDINLNPPRIDASSWRLQIDGLVERPLALTLDELRALPAVTATITLECISNPLGGDLISTSRWTGAPLRDVLRMAGLRSDVRAIQMDAADGFYESISMADVDDERVLLVYAMNGEPLMPMHGFPLRIYIPNHHGMKQPKWLTRLQARADTGRGYWVERGWSKEAIVKTTSVIDAVGPSVGGIAYAGARGISKVEVQVDNGPWAEAKLIAPPLGPLTWVLWRHDWPYRPGRHTFRVRAYDGTGALQPTTPHGPRPDGSSGIHEITRTV
jgi:DMSO/TMAO reductase YedYZ molybdopterin-dependent catalytic subunit